MSSHCVWSALYSLCDGISFRYAHANLVPYILSPNSLCIYLYFLPNQTPHCLVCGLFGYILSIHLLLWLGEQQFPVVVVAVLYFELWYDFALHCMFDDVDEDHRICIPTSRESAAISLLFIGKPEPMVAWHVNGDLEDATFHSDRYGNVINELVFRGLNRTHLNSQFSCKASNTRLIQPVEKSVVLDLNRKLNFAFSSTFNSCCK